MKNAKPKSKDVIIKEYLIKPQVNDHTEIAVVQSKSADVPVNMNDASVEVSEKSSTDLSNIMMCHPAERVAS